MARRPRSHQIEDISVRRFDDALPVAWVSRAIHPDYGVDREVEIFKPDDTSTGMKFAVQLKATDVAERADRVRLKSSQLDYLLDYELPGIVVRYDASADVLRWQWATHINARTPRKSGQKTLTHRFAPDDIWNEQTPAKIERALRARRALASFPASGAMPVRLEISETLDTARYSIGRTVQSIVAGSSGTLIVADSETAEVELYIRVREDLLSVDFDMLGSMTFDLDPKDAERLSSAILYAMAFLFARKRLATHARAAGSAILQGGHVAGNADLVAHASYAFADDAMGQAELAILNDLHDQNSLYYPVIVGQLVKTGMRNGGPAAVARFLMAALEAATDDSTRTAAIHYSTANALRETEPALAMFHYNRARRLRPAYFKADYFLSELGGTLFNAKRYACSRQLYERAINIAPSTRLQLCLGDAMLFDGDPQAAADQFDLASQSDIPEIVEEAVVKFELSKMLVTAHGASMPADWSRPMRDVPPGMDERVAWLEHLVKINALDPLAHFNLGVSDAKLGDHASALGHFIACAIVQSGDLEAWSNAIICAFQSAQAELAVTLVRLSIGKAGLDAYDTLRSNLVAQNVDSDLLAELDNIAISADAHPGPSMLNRVTLRILDGDDAIVIDENVD